MTTKLNDDILASTGNTAKEQEMFFAGVEAGEANAKNNTEVRGAAGWLPIESAPKTGRTLLLGYWNSLGKWRTVRGQWMSFDYIANHWEDPDDAEEGWFETAVEAEEIPNCWPITPTHWMPLPAEPGAAPAAPVSTVEQDEQPARLTDGYWWPTTASQLKRVAAELIRAADAMGAADDDDEEADLILSVVPTGAICLDEDDPEGRNLHPVLAVSIADYADEGAYPVDPLDPTGGRPEEAPAAGDALDAARLDWLEQHDGRFFNKDRISSIVGVGFLVAGDLTGARHQSVRAAIDAAIEAQRKGAA